MWRLLLRVVVYVLIIVIVVGGVGVFGQLRSDKMFWAAVRELPVPSLEGLEKPKHDANKPTVAVVLGNEVTEGLDFTIPYQIFAMTGQYNVYAVAEDNEVRSLSGGLDVVPHYSFRELDALLGKSPDIIAIPYMTMFRADSYKPVGDWIRKNKDTMLVSICAGADNLAATGLLEGKLGATHWQTMPALTRKYPGVKWVEDMRFVTNGTNMVSSAGISSGIDAVLYVISQQLGEPAAARIAKEMNYPTYHFAQNPKVDPFYMDFRFATYVLNNAYHWNKTEMGVMFYDGVEEMALASVFDIYSDSGTTQVTSVAQSERPLVTKHGLNILSRSTIAEAPSFDKMIIPGSKARALAADEVKSWTARKDATVPQFVHNDATNRFLFEVQLEDLAKQEDLLTAKHAVKRLEFRGEDIHLEGRALPLETYGALLITLVGAILIAFYIDRRFMTKRKLPHTASA
jgi:AraC family transcriptional regulator, transcriptional activator FtrA